MGKFELDLTSHLFYKFVTVVSSIILCYESNVQAIPVNRLLKGVIVGAMVYYDVHCPRHTQQRPVISYVPVMLVPDSGIYKNNTLDHNRLLYE